MTYKSHYSHRAIRLAFGRWLHKPPLAREHGVKVGRLKHLVDLDRLSRTLEFDGVRLAILLQAVGRKTRQRDVRNEKVECAYWSNIFLT